MKFSIDYSNEIGLLLNDMMDRIQGKKRISKNKFCILKKKFKEIFNFNKANKQILIGIIIF